MTLKECKKEEKADREFQKKFKVSGNKRLLIPLSSPPRPGRAHGNGREELCSAESSQHPGHTRPAPRRSTPSSDRSHRPFGCRGICCLQAGRAAGAARLTLPGGGCQAAALLVVLQFEGSISVLTQMMVDPAATEKRGGGKNLPLRRGEILDVIQFTNEEQILCRNSQRRCKSGGAGAVPAAHRASGRGFFAHTTPRRQQETSPCCHTDLTCTQHLKCSTSLCTNVLLFHPLSTSASAVSWACRLPLLRAFAAPGASRPPARHTRLCHGLHEPRLHRRVLPEAERRGPGSPQPAWQAHSLLCPEQVASQRPAAPCPQLSPGRETLRSPACPGLRPRPCPGSRHSLTRFSSLSCRRLRAPRCDAPPVSISSPVPSSPLHEL